MSTVTGGGGSDVYIIQSDGGKTIIDNFAEDSKHDIVVINVDYRNVKCHQTRNDLDVTYSKSHHIQIKSGFSASDYYIVKKTCLDVQINNADSREKIDLLFIEEQFPNLQSRKGERGLKLMSRHGTPTIQYSKMVRFKGEPASCHKNFRWNNVANKQ